MSEASKCTCEWCTVTSPLCKKIMSLLTDKKDKEGFDNIINNLMMAETDAVYWKEKFYGTWPSDTAEDISRHIKILENRIEELQSDKDYKNSLTDQVS